MKRIVNFLKSVELMEPVQKNKGSPMLVNLKMINIVDLLNPANSQGNVILMVNNALQIKQKTVPLLLFVLNRVYVPE